MRKRRAVITFIVGTILLALLAGAMPRLIQESMPSASLQRSDSAPSRTDAQQQAREASEVLATLEVKGRAPKTGYARAEFGSGWSRVNGCSTRDIILYRDLTNVTLDGECKVTSGTLNDPYTATTIEFTRERSDAVQIDHIVPLSNAWQTGAQQFTLVQRQQLANDPLELLAVDGKANQAKSDGDAATWLPGNKSFRCTYVVRQIAVKKKYTLWVTEAERQAMVKVLEQC